jgi:hypothetical protein
VSLEEWRPSGVLPYVHLAINKTTAPGRRAAQL